MSEEKISSRRLQGGFMGSLISKDYFYLSLCLITLFNLASCATNTTARVVAEENSIKRAPEGNYRVSTNQEASRQFARDRN